jgi:hypothetical protein
MKGLCIQFPQTSLFVSEIFLQSTVFPKKRLLFDLARPLAANKVLES